MSIYDLDAPALPETPVRPEAVLAAAVIRQALLDARGRSSWVRPADAEDARRFLADEDGSLSWWCDIAGLLPEAVRQLVKVVLDGRDGGGDTFGRALPHGRF